MSSQPATVFNLPAGQLKVGHTADITLMDLNQPYLIKATDFLSKGKNSPFIGRQVYGRTKLTLVNGSIAYQDGSVE